MVKDAGTKGWSNARHAPHVVGRGEHHLLLTASYVTPDLRHARKEGKEKIVYMAKKKSRQEKWRANDMHSFCCSLGLVTHGVRMPVGVWWWWWWSVLRLRGQPV